ncbi:MAG: FAD:protein FMN transferase [Oscillospiraceae bacterium]|nr:FAD:protein FMN transferase [Oscillospiraceae bacterium]
MKHSISPQRIVAIVLCLCAMLSLSACGETRMSQRQVFAMDTVMTLTAYGKKAENGLNAAQGVIQSMNDMLDPDIETSTTYAINHAQGANISVSGQVAKMLSTAATVYKQSGGALDLSIYPVIQRWGFDSGRYYVPTDEELYEDLSRRAYGQMTLTSFPSSGSYAVSFPSGTEISFGAVAKGCAADNAITAMRNAGVTSGIVSLGGNVQTLGLKPDGSNWTIAVQDPNNTASFLGVVSVGETAVVTSGTYQRFFTQNGKTYHHLINPETGRPINNTLLSATIICEDGTLADCLSTAMFILGESKAINYWRTYGGFDMILVNKEYQVTCTKGLIEKFTLTNNNYTLSYVE